MWKLYAIMSCLFFAPLAAQDHKDKHVVVCAEAEKVYSFLATSLSQQKQLGSTVVIAYLQNELNEYTQAMQNFSCKIPHV